MNRENVAGDSAEHARQAHAMIESRVLVKARKPRVVGRNSLVKLDPCFREEPDGVAFQVLDTFLAFPDATHAKGP